MMCSNCYDTDSWEYVSPDDSTGVYELDDDSANDAWLDVLADRKRDDRDEGPCATGQPGPIRDPREDQWETLCDTEDTQTIEQTIAGLRESRQVQTIEDVTPPYPFCSGYPTKADCARRGYCAREITCDN